MKKLLLVLGLIVSTQSAFAINPDSVLGKSWVRRATTVCVKDLVLDDLWSIEFAHKYCNCTMRKFVSALSFEEIELYGDDDPEMEVKADKLIEKFGTECMKALAE